jgi:hypothetical protein
LPDHPQATLFNDVAIAAFVLDVVLVMVGWPPAANEDAGGRERGSDHALPSVPHG